MTDLSYLLLVALPIIFISMSLHELMHGLVSYWLGDDTARLQGRLTLNPIAHIDPVMTIGLPLLLILLHSPFLLGAAKPVQVNYNRLKYGEFGGALVAIAGPLTNLVLALVASLVFAATSPYSGLLYNIAGYTVLINLIFFIFNLIPWPPLDGSRVLYAFAPEPLRNVMNYLERLGLLGIFVVILIIYPPIYMSIGIPLIDNLAPGFLTNLGL